MRDWLKSLIVTVAAICLSVKLWRAPWSVAVLMTVIAGYLGVSTGRLYRDNKKTKNQKARELFDSMQQVSIYRLRDNKKYTGPLANVTNDYISIYVVRIFDLRTHRVLLTEIENQPEVKTPPSPPAPNAA